MKKYCIVSFCNLYILPYASTYIKSIIDNNNECYLLFWDRDGLNGERDVYDSCRKIVFNKKMEAEVSIFKKLKSYFFAIRYISKVICTTDFDGLIFLQSHAAVFCSKVLKKYYKNKYIIDVRDYSLENIGLYYRQEKKAIKNAKIICISSPAYSRFLPQGNFIIAHNYVPFSDEKIKRVRNSVNPKSRPIKISFIGTVRFFEMDRRILLLFANDERYQINYYGKNSEVLKEFCKKKNIYNVAFYGSFPPDSIDDFYVQTDLINNLYGNNSPFLDYALSNKLYHAAQFNLPILVCPGTYMEEISYKWGIGYSFNVDDANCKDNLFNWFNGIDRNIFADNCERFLNSVIDENNEFYDAISDFTK